MKNTTRYQTVLPLFDLKLCVRCHTDKPTSDFCKNSHTQDGIHRYCKRCLHEMYAKRKAANPDIFKEYSRRNYEKLRQRRHDYSAVDLASKRTCRICKEIKPLSQFYRLTIMKNGFGTMCAACHKTQHELRYATFPEAFKSYSKRSHEKRRDMARVTSKIWRSKNRDKLLELKRSYKHAEKARLRRKERYASDVSYRAKISAVGRMRKALKRGAPNVSLVLPHVIAARDSWICHLCLKPIDPAATDAKSRLNLDHIIPVSKGGLHIPENLKAAHGSCNARRNNKPLELGYII